MVRAQIFIQPFLTPMNKFLAMMDWIYTEWGFESQSIYKMDIDFIIVRLVEIMIIEQEMIMFETNTIWIVCVDQGRRHM